MTLPTNESIPSLERRYLRNKICEYLLAVPLSFPFQRLFQRPRVWSQRLLQKLLSWPERSRKIWQPRAWYDNMTWFMVLVVTAQPYCLGKRFSALGISILKAICLWTPPSPLPPVEVPRPQIFHMNYYMRYHRWLGSIQAVMDWVFCTSVITFPLIPL